MASLEGRERGEREGEGREGGERERGRGERGGREGGGGERENVYLMKIIITVDMYVCLFLSHSSPCC